MYAFFYVLQNFWVSKNAIFNGEQLIKLHIKYKNSTNPLTPHFTSKWYQQFV